MYIGRDVASERFYKDKWTQFMYYPKAKKRPNLEKKHSCIFTLANALTDMRTRPNPAISSVLDDGDSHVYQGYYCSSMCYAIGKLNSKQFTALKCIVSWT